MKELGFHTDSLNPTSFKKNMKFNTICLHKPSTMSLFTDQGSIGSRILTLLRTFWFALSKVGKIMSPSLLMNSIKLIFTQLWHGIFLKHFSINLVSSTSEWILFPKRKSIQTILLSRQQKNC